MATTVKLSKPEQFYPRQAGIDPSVTKARRAWLDAKVIELQALGYEAKVCGIGSYQYVSARKPVTVEGRVQYRGTCQACGRKQATDGMIAKHGYEVRHRGQGGFFVGTCQGSGRKPAEQDLTFAKHLLMLYGDYILARQTRLPIAERLAQSAVAPTVKRPPLVWHNRKRVPDTSTPEYTAAADAWAHHDATLALPRELKDEIWQIGNMRDTIIKHVLPMFGQKLVEVIV